MAIDVYINYNGNCREAVEFYAKVFKTESPNILTFGSAPPNPEFPVSKEAKDLVMHTELVLKGTRLMFSDVLPGMGFNLGSNISLVFGSEDNEEIRNVFNSLKEGGTVEMELQETFWSKCYGMVTDKYGISWMVSGESK